MQFIDLRKSIFAAAMAGLLLSGGTVSAQQNLQFNQIREKMSFDSSPVQSVNGVIASYAPALENATPAVVTIFSKSDPVPRGGDDESADPREEILRRLLGLGGPGRPMPGQSGLGSGVILSPDGYILTNNHVVEGADRITVALKGNKREYPAILIGGDKETDVALIKIEAQNLTPMQIGDSSKVKVGDVVLAVGNPLGLEQTVTQGIVSALGRRDLNITADRATGRLGYENFIQTDASINVGNSGGALIDAEGRLIGMNTAIKTDGLSRGNMGIAFAIPSNMAINIVRKLVDGGGKVRRGFLGIGLDDIGVDIADKLGLKNLKGALVKQVHQGTPAEIAGLEENDVVVEINNQSIDDAAQLRLVISGKDPGDEVDFRIIRGGKDRKVSVVLGDKDELEQLISSRAAVPQNPRRPDLRRDRAPVPQPRVEPAGNDGGFLPGVELQDLDRNLRSALKVDPSIRGVFVSSVQEGSEAAKAGLEAGQIITQIDQKTVASADDARTIVSEFDGQFVLVQIFKDGRRSILAVPLN
ncbi:MAG: trypsin-like peptidase domain-containing protein [Verrucomicrobiales bacterium]|nr:trypsin-like peptidase domain-containing protein [Verrucomicrobiales bacterium]